MRSSLVRLGAATFVLALGFFASLHTFSSAHAVNHTVYIVTTAADSGPGSLRQALEDVNASPGHDTITFAVTGMITLDSPLPAIGDDLTLQGPGAGELAISGGYLYRIFDISPTVAVTVTDLALVEGRAPNGEAGGAIHSLGQLHLVNVDLHDNLSTSVGGAISAEEGVLRVDTSQVLSNIGGNNGGIYVGDATGHITGTVLAYNHGSAVEAYRTPALYITATQITSSTGRGIDVDNTDLFLDQATVGANAAGGISTWSGIFSINDSTIVGNRGNEGAGIYSVWGSVIMTDTKLLGNHAGLNGGAAYVSVGSRELTLTRTTVSGNTGPYGAGIYLAGGDLQIKASNILANVGEHGPAIYFSSLHDAVVTNSCIVNNWVTDEDATAIELSSYNTYYVSAPNNWWGATDGPGGAGTGTGDSVGGRVIFAGFKTSQPYDCPQRLYAYVYIPALSKQ